MNLEKLAGRGRRPDQGDVFELCVKNGPRVLGLVVGDGQSEVVRTPVPGAYLIYVFDPTPWSDDIPRGRVSGDDLLIPPAYTNQRPWTLGYFRVMRNERDVDRLLLSRHCFEATEGVFLDERRNRISQRWEPCGIWAGHSLEWLDDQISDALGIARAPIF
jgi:hypothetical protein